MCQQSDLSQFVEFICPNNLIRYRKLVYAKLDSKLAISLECFKISSWILTQGRHTPRASFKLYSVSDQLLSGTDYQT